MMVGHGSIGPSKLGSLTTQNQIQHRLHTTREAILISICPFTNCQVHLNHVFRIIDYCSCSQAVAILASAVKQAGTLISRITIGMSALVYCICQSVIWVVIRWVRLFIDYLSSNSHEWWYSTVCREICTAL